MSCGPVGTAALVESGATPASARVPSYVESRRCFAGAGKTRSPLSNKRQASHPLPHGCFRFPGSSTSRGEADFLLFDERIVRQITTVEGIRPHVAPKGPLRARGRAVLPGSEVRRLVGILIADLLTYACAADRSPPRAFAQSLLEHLGRS